MKRSQLFLPVGAISLLYGTPRMQSILGAWSTSVSLPGVAYQVGLKVAYSVFATGHDPGYTIGMKTAISLPDDLFHAAERHAKRERKPRSQLYAEALAEYLARHAPDEVTEAMNRVVERLGDCGPEPFVAAAGRRVFESTEW